MGNSRALAGRARGILHNIQPESEDSDLHRLKQAMLLLSEAIHHLASEVEEAKGTATRADRWARMGMAAGYRR